MSLAKLTTLFQEGTEVVLSPPQDPSTTIVVWVAKLNAFEEEEANQEARVARARRMNSHRELGTPEYQVLQERRNTATSLEMIEQILVTREPRMFSKALAELRSDEDWTERMEVIEFSDVSTLSGEELELVHRYERDMRSELVTRQLRLVDDLRHELSEMPMEDLRDHFCDEWLEQRGFDTFNDERACQQLYISMRTCVATPPAEGSSWDHSGCDHQQRFLASAREVRLLPQFVRDKVEEAYATISVSPSLARFTAALASSSDSPEPSAKEEASTPSGPEVTSDAPATT